jgi:flagellar motor switch/type III secretory pathway protein FliN
MSEKTEVNLDDVYMDITVELSRRELFLSEGRGINTGDVINFDNLAGEAFDVLLNGHSYAEGEIVVSDLMAVRLTRMMDWETDQ